MIKLFAKSRGKFCLTASTLTDENVSTWLILINVPKSEKNISFDRFLGWTKCVSVCAIFSGPCHLKTKSSPRVKNEYPTCIFYKTRGWKESGVINLKCFHECWKIDFNNFFFLRNAEFGKF